jgi:hypothetical protein
MQRGFIGLSNLPDCWQRYDSSPEFTLPKHFRDIFEMRPHVIDRIISHGSWDRHGKIHLLNLLYPNIFETGPHVIDQFDRIISLLIGSFRVAVGTVGTGMVMNSAWAFLSYLLQ